MVSTVWAIVAVPISYCSVATSCLLLLIVGCCCHDSVATTHRVDYCVVGAGPAGLQMAYFLKAAKRDYVVFEKSARAGSFFEKFPRHNVLISINKRYTGKSNSDFNLRHDWNSLINERVLFGSFDRAYLPQRESMLRYLEVFQRAHALNVRFNTTVLGVIPAADSDGENRGRRRVLTADGHTHACRRVVVATGFEVPHIPSSELAVATGYEHVSTRAADFDNKSVLILGKGNSAFEVAKHVYGHASVVHVLGRSRVRLSWATHYVGDVRGVNNELLDSYQLKSLDGIGEVDVTHLGLKRTNGRFTIENTGKEYDHVIRCLGWRFNHSIFPQGVVSEDVTKLKYPPIRADYRSTTMEGVYFAGTNTHSLDFRRSAGGFIHGFRYTTRSLHRMLEWTMHHIPWPHTTVRVLDLTSVIVRRLNEASGIYQMFNTLSDVVLVDEVRGLATYLEEYPIADFSKFPEHSGHRITEGSVFVVNMEYGANYSSPSADTFAENRVNHRGPAFAHLSNFLHPVIYFYQNGTLLLESKASDIKTSMPRPTRMIHLMEDFDTDFTDDHNHLNPLRRFIEAALSFDGTMYSSRSCLKFYLTHSRIPLSCRADQLRIEDLLDAESDTATSMPKAYNMYNEHSPVVRFWNV